MLAYLPECSVKQCWGNNELELKVSHRGYHVCSVVLGAVMLQGWVTGTGACESKAALGLLLHCPAPVETSVHCSTQTLAPSYFIAALDSSSTHVDLYFIKK